MGAGAASLSRGRSVGLNQAQQPVGTATQGPGGNCDSPVRAARRSGQQHRPHPVSGLIFDCSGPSQEKLQLFLSRLMDNSFLLLMRKYLSYSLENVEIHLV